MKEYSRAIAGAIRQYLDDDDWNYRFDEENGVFEFNLTIDCRLDEIEIFIHVGEDHFYSLSSIKLCATEDVRESMCELLTRCNYGLLNGNFEMNYSNGKIRYKSYNNCNDMLPTDAIIDDSIFIPANMFKRFCDAIIAVLFGLQNPKEAVDAVRGEK